MKRIANDNKKCEGCKHMPYHSNFQWCYMFKDEPDILPCGQHDKYAKQRKENGKKIYNSIKAKKEQEYENTAADDYLDYLHDQW